MKRKDVIKKTEKVYSPVDDKNIRKDVNNSPIWEKAIHPDELKDAPKYKEMFEYTIKFEDTRPIQVTNVKKLKKW